MKSVENIKEYLISLGFKADIAGYNRVKSVIDDLSRRVQEQTTGMTRNYMKAGGVIASTYLSVAGATATLLEKVAQADLGYQKFALRMYMAKEQAKQLKIVTDSMGESLENIAWIPELRGRYFQLLKESKGMEPGSQFEKDALKLREMRNEFARLKVEATYATQWIGMYLVKYLSGPLGDIQTKFKGFNDWIQRNMPSWTEKVAGWLTTFLKLGEPVIRLITGIKDRLIELSATGGPLGRALILIGAILTGVFLTGPLGLATIALTGFIYLLKDFFDWADGKQSSKLLAPVWSALAGVLDGITRSIILVISLIDGLHSGKSFKKAWKEAKEMAIEAPGVVGLLNSNNELYQKDAEGRQRMGLPQLGYENGKTSAPLQLSEKSLATSDKIVGGLLLMSPIAAYFLHKKAAQAEDKMYSSKGLMGLFGIGKQESGGDYNATGPLNTKGRGKAQGKYQILPSNWPSWSAMSGLGNNAPMTPQNQEIVAKHMYDLYMQEFKDERLAATAWIAGPARARKLQSGDTNILNWSTGGGLKQTVGQYIKATTGKEWNKDQNNNSTTSDYLSKKRNFAINKKWDNDLMASDYLSKKRNFAINKKWDNDLMAYNYPSPTSNNLTNTFSMGDVNVSVNESQSSPERIADMVTQRIKQEFDKNNNMIISRNIRTLSGVIQ